MIEMRGGRSGGVEERRGRRRRRKREEGRGWYITSKLVQLEVDQIASRVINQSARCSTPRESQISRM